jgi:(p)ppGpp synthase/HD superfamily hydrolase
VSPGDSPDPAEADLEFLLGRRERADAMADRLRRTAGWRGLSPDQANRLADCFLAAMRRRAAAIGDEHDPAYLHPARTALILLDDVGMQDADVLYAAVVHDAARPGLAMRSDDLRDLAGDRAADIIDRLPNPDADADTIMETLVTLPAGVLALYLASQLDLARHLHLGDPAGWTAGHARVTASLIPLAHRCNPLLAKRFERWAGAFRRRFLGRLD